MKTTFTPGPWHVYDCTQINEGKLIGCFDIITKPSYMDGVKAIAHALPYGGNFPTRDEAKANACLISAAPDMLTALQVIVATCHVEGADEHIEAIKNVALEAIQKATT